MNEQSKLQNNEDDCRLITFVLDGRDYAIDIMDVREISRDISCTYVPNSPNFVKGICTLHGELVTVIDLRSLLNVSSDLESREVIFVGSRSKDVSNHTIGMVVDSINDVVTLKSEDIKHPHPILDNINTRYIRGVVDVSGTLYVILESQIVFVDDLGEITRTSYASESGGCSESQKNPEEPGMK